MRQCWSPPAARRGFRVESIPGLTALWKESGKGDPAIVVAILDGAVDLSHPVLRGANLVQRDALGRSSDRGRLTREHATHVASIIFGRHGGLVSGIAPNCKGIVIPIYRDDGSRALCSQKDLAKAINEAIRLGAHVINISGGERSPDATSVEELRQAVQNCVRHDRLIVAAAGNDGCRECLHVPGALPSVLAVGAMDDAGTPLPSSNWGEVYRLQGILAPGDGILGAIPRGGVAPRSGSSFAAPIVAGIAALLLSVQKKRGQRLDPFLVREALVRTAQGCGEHVTAACDRLLAGRLSVPGAIRFLLPGGQRMTSQVTPQCCGDERQDDETGQPTASANAGEIEQLSSDAPRHSGGGLPPRAMAQAPLRGPDASTAVVPSCGCGCKGGRQLVYAIGELDIDLVSPQRRESIQQSSATRLPPAFFDNGIENRAVFLRHLLGTTFTDEGLAPYPETVRDAISEIAREGLLPKGSLHDAESVYWVLKQADCPLYVLKPQGAFAEAAYRQLVLFLIEQTFKNYQAFLNQGISEHCLNEFYGCYGGTQQPFRDSMSRPETVSLVKGTDWKKPDTRAPGRRRRGRAEEGSRTEEGKTEERDEGSPQESSADFARPTPDDVVTRAFDLFGEPAVSASHVAIAGEVIGKVQLFTGEEVEVVAPVIRGMQNWNTRRLIEMLVDEDALNISGFVPQVTLLVLKIVSRLYEAVRNPGKDPCDRAKNFFATKELVNLAQTLVNPVFLSTLGAFGPPQDAGEDQRDFLLNVREFMNIAVDDLQCKPSTCVRFGSEPYDVELSFYNFANQFMGSTVLSQTIDVSDVVPSATDRLRVFPRRA